MLQFICSKLKTTDGTMAKRPQAGRKNSHSIRVLNTTMKD
jgi:hypothetical protein